MNLLTNTIDEKGILIEEDISFPQKDLNEINIENLEKAKVKGRVYLNITEEIIIDLLFEGIMILKDAVDNSMINHPFSIEIKEAFEKNDENNQNLLDINLILWQNIVLEVPIRIVKSEDRDNSLKGEGWELKSEDTSSIDPRLSPLMDLLKEGKE